MGTSEVKKGLGEIKVTGEVSVFRFGLDLTGPADEEWHAVGKFVHPALIEPAVVAEVKPLVGRIDHHRIFSQPTLVQIFEQAPDVFVHRLGAEQVVTNPTLVVPPGQLLLAHGIPFREESLIARAEVTIKDLELFGGKLAGVLKHQPLVPEVLKYSHLVFAGG